VEPKLPQHDETIVPVRPSVRGTPARGRASGRLARASLTLAGTVALVAAAAAAFYWLPARVEQQREAARPVAAAPAPVVVEPARPVLSPEESAVLRTQAGRVLAGLLTLQDDLTRLNVADWAADDWAKYRQLSDAGDNAFLAEDFAAAVASYSEARALGDALVARAATTLAAALAAADTALAAGDAPTALEQYAVVLTIEPTHRAALTGRARAERLPEVLALMQRADLALARDELQPALAAYREAAAVDPDWPAASAGIATVNRLLRTAEYERLLSAGFSLLGAQDYAAARREFEAALEVRPGSHEATDGLAQAEAGAKLDAIKLAEARALAFERRELWDQAIDLYRSVLAGDETLKFAQTGLERAQARAGLDAKLVNLIDNAGLLLDDTVLADARGLLESAAAEPDKGPRLTAQVEQLEDLIDLATKPIPVRLESDQLTSVTLYRVGTLGAFAAKDVELRPGTYTVIGSRDGYRDVRRTFTVRPGRNLAPINVVCVEPI
jgi:hypothetical protein